jgi:hypothetical protein
MATSAAAQEAIPELAGSWTGKFQSTVYGNNPHHPGNQTIDSPPRVREVTFTIDIAGQDGRRLWGTSWSDPASKEPFALALSFDNRTLYGADTDGYFHLTILDKDRLECCYTHNGLSPSKSIVAACGIVERKR